MKNNKKTYKVLLVEDIFHLKKEKFTEQLESTLDKKVTAESFEFDLKKGLKKMLKHNVDLDITFKPTVALENIAKKEYYLVNFNSYSF